jgi:hypothetical protein
MEHTSLSDALISLIPTYGPWIIFGIVALEGAGVPLPGEAILVAAALLAATTGQISIVVVALLRDMGVSVVQSLDAGAPGKRKTLRSGVPGRPTSKHLVLEKARCRLDAGDYPSKLSVFSRELADALRNEEPAAAPMTAKTVANAIRKLWNEHQKPLKPAGSP